MAPNTKDEPCADEECARRILHAIGPDLPISVVAGTLCYVLELVYGTYPEGRLQTRMLIDYLILGIQKIDAEGLDEWDTRALIARAVGDPPPPPPPRNPRPRRRA